MRKPAELWQVLCGILAGAAFIFSIQTENKVQNTEIQQLKEAGREYNQQLKTIDSKLTEILVTIQNKQDRK